MSQPNSERRGNEDRRSEKRRVHPRVAIVPVPTDRRREERREKKKRR